MIGVFSRAIYQIPHLEVFLGGKVLLRPSATDKNKLSCIVGWGRKPSTIKARKYTKTHSLPFLALEDGFLRSVGLGKTSPPLSIVTDSKGIYYDATQPSQLEELVCEKLSPGESKRAQRLISLWQTFEVSKYNHLRDYEENGLEAPIVLVVDQTLGDESIRFGLADTERFSTMLKAALSENPNSKILLKVHPDALAGYKKSNFELETLQDIKNLEVVDQAIHLTSLLKIATRIYTVTSQVGFEALMWEKPVRCFGMPFYAGWGLTDDDVPAPDRREPISLEQLVHAALVQYPRYIDPETEQLCEVETVIQHLGLQRKFRQRFPQQVFALNFSRWKKPIVERFLWGSQVNFVKDAADAPDGSSLFVWGTKPIKGELNENISIIRLEDGFLRSVGLGADLVTPISWVADTRGIYYDSRSESDLEHYLANHKFDRELLARAKRLRTRIIELGMTKYNVGTSGWTRPSAKHVILVPGQVEDDASIRFGAPNIASNIELLKAVRHANPEAYIVYKPHPDVLAGLRCKDSLEGLAENYCNEIVTDASMHSLLESVDEVHLMTSLTGFEALIRGLKVTCYGQPFYSGWSLTTDMRPVERRTRQLSLDELVAATLILYPTYISQVTGRYTTPERALIELQEWRDKKGISSSGPWLKAKRTVLSLTAKLRTSRA